MFLRDRISPYAVATVSRTGTQVAAFGAMLVAIRAVDAAAFGAYSVAWVTVVIGNTLVYTGLYQYLLRTRDVEAASGTVLWILLGEGVLLSGLVALAGFVIHVAGSTSVATCFLILSPVIPITAVMAWSDAQLTRAGRNATVSVIQFLSEVVAAFTLIGGIKLGWTTAALLVARLVAVGIGASCLTVLVARRPRAPWSSSIAKEALKEAFPIQASALVSAVAMYAADWLLAGFLSRSESGAYRAASRIAITGAAVFLEPLRPLTWKALAEHERADDRDAMKRTFLEHLKMLAFFAWPALLCLALSSHRIFSAIATQNWSGAAPVLVVLSASRLADVFLFFLDPVLVCTGRSVLQLRIRMFSTAVFVGGVVLAARSGALAVARWQLVYLLVIGLFSLELTCRSFFVKRLQAARALVPGTLTALLCVSVGEITYRAAHTSALARLSYSVAAMAVCMIVSFLLLYRRGVLTLPRRTG
jgi:O-antigen/teichoic acid export membrane protein